MSRIRDALGQLPSRPGFLIAAIVALGIGGWYYGTAYARCSALQADRAQLQQAIEAASESVLDLARLVPGDWDEVRIAQGHRPAAGENPLDCPFGWDLSAAERQALIDRGDYTLIGFFRDGAFQHYIEFRRDRAEFKPAASSLPRSSARFSVTPPAEPGAPYTLAPAS